MKNILSITSILSCLLLMATTQGFAQDEQDLHDEAIKHVLTGGASRTWELHEIHWTDNKVLQDDEFSDNKEYTQTTELAQLVPETIVFHADGACDITYSSHYNEGKLVVEPLQVRGTWEFDGLNVKVMEPSGDGGMDAAEGSAWWMQEIRVSEGKIESKFNMYGYNDGISEIEYGVQQ